MKSVVRLYIFLSVTILLSSCNKPVVTPPDSSPKERFAPEGVFYVIKYFSVTTDTAIYGFPLGKKVNLVREKDGVYFVTDGRVEGSASKESFTNDLDYLENVISTIKTKNAVANKLAQQAAIIAQKNEEAYRRLQDQQDISLRKIKLQNQIRETRHLIEDSQKILRDHQNNRGGGIIKQSAEDKAKEDQIKVMQRQIEAWETELRNLR